ncbi:N-acetylglucosamine-6-phosphate deacetylase [Stratiformator vulcanicus]|uniref:N-acetylglucosamine-6-phosphate deacetylase n=1 Tax=Stratiformator vulcanicus TaxID=2527980 RepID=A0A517R194_9PLAN|nr:N-acetylglucosamine-6-phosphate deacetylase [Stratiformator vulcanicus]QDT37667.1 N-acetylglucosamine-6-phosphate deacetylase [Stratiformator vulcanicus]
MKEQSGYVDLQVNGYAGVDFNSDGLTAERLHEACVALRRDGVESILATIITDDVDTMCDRLSAIVAGRLISENAKQTIAGVHIEGPFLNRNPGYIGAHPQSAARPADCGVMQQLLEAAGGLTKIVTLAPECDAGFKTTRWLSEQGIAVAAGHSNATLDELRGAIDAGLSMFTHLGNGCPAELPRHDNIVQRVLSLSDQIKISFIADGAHVPLFALKNYLDLAGIENCIVVSDAISAAGLGPGRYTLGGQTIEVGDDLIPWSADQTHFVGSATTMRRMEENLLSIGLSREETDFLLRVGPETLLDIN